MMKIVESKGDVLKAEADLICHQVNCLGIMGGGLAKQVKEQYPRVYEEYLHFVKSFKKDHLPLLGIVQYCYLDNKREIANVFGQEFIGTKGRMTNYDALREAFTNIARYISNCKIKTVAIPKYFGCGLAGGDWDTVLGIITDALNDLDITLEIVEFAK